ncbi:hypothetical protein Rsub_08283 [Raphidocelis subcapitata]|uniref:Uncharacterized protein n=1 Tax=Raphidocelis subcapitata TaxID=307507 RepID=A0A2V0P8I5_9CHLO|nr:hypothetical protein Rsub_08283 [Raphidocelis subcapitata]|eukprot:GBF95252.1 hypothetical protein Rsub_08283 [Raphidocelis subcapitata]
MLPSVARGVARCLRLRAGDAAGSGSGAWATAAAARRPQQQQQQQQRAAFSSGGVDIEAETSAINDAFVQAREDIADARDDAETTYFNESHKQASESVGEVLSLWTSLLGKLPEKQRGEVMRSMGLKMEQLKAELKELDEMHA